jgi:hypothetical protein
MPNKRYVVTLAPDERGQLEALVPADCRGSTPPAIATWRPPS